MRHDRRQVAGAQRLHRLDYRGYPAGDVANHVNPDANADQHAEDKNDHLHAKCKVIGFGGPFTCDVSALFMELDILAQNRVGLHSGRQHRFFIQFLRLTRNASGTLARQIQDVLRALKINIPLLAPFAVEGTLFWRGDQLFIAISNFG
jgi:hypothetical protein